MTYRERLSERLEQERLPIVPARFEALNAYLELLVKWNRRINLTGFSFERDTEAALDRLLFEPLAAARIARAGRRVMDVGSGGGSPAIPFFLGLEGDTAELVLVESRTKKAVFLREALRVTGIRGYVAAERFEQVVVPEPPDIVTVRAVAADASLWALLRRTMSPTGRIFWFHSASQSQPFQDVVAWQKPVRLLHGDSRLSVGTTAQ